MFASLILAFILLCILGFSKLVQIQSKACEAGTYYAPLSSPEEWSASLDVALGLDMFSVSTEEALDAAWDMLPLPHAWVGAHMGTPVEYTHEELLCAYSELRTMCYV